MDARGASRRRPERARRCGTRAQPARAEHLLRVVEHERFAQHVVHVLDEHDAQSLEHAARDFAQVLAVLLAGSDTVVMPLRCAARSFSFRPPIGITRPRSVISPVIATSRLTGMRVSALAMLVAIVTPALGPSLRMNSGKCTCTSIFW